MNHISERIREIFWTGIDRPSPGSWQSPILTVVERSRDEHGSERLSFKSITRRTRARFVLRMHFVPKPADVEGHRGHIAHNAASVQKSAKYCRAQWQYLDPSIGGWCTASAVSTAHRVVANETPFFLSLLDRGTRDRQHSDTPREAVRGHENNCCADGDEPTTVSRRFHEIQMSRDWSTRHNGNPLKQSQPSHKRRSSEASSCQKATPPTVSTCRLAQMKNTTIPLHQIGTSRTTPGILASDRNCFFPGAQLH